MIVACIFHFMLNGINQERLVTGQLVKDLNTVLIVDISNAADFFGLKDSDYHNYTIPKEECTLGKSAGTVRNNDPGYKSLQEPKHWSDYYDEFTEASAATYNKKIKMP